MKWLMTALVFATFYVTAESANAYAGDSNKPGSYAQHSGRYAAFIANCTDGGMTPSLRDEGAKKLDAMSQSQFDLQIRFCAKREAERHPPQRMAGNVMVRGGVAVRPPYERDVNSSDENSSNDEDDAKLNELLERKALKLFGPPSHKNYTFDGVRKTFKAVPAGCTERRERTNRGTMVRLDCP